MLNTEFIHSRRKALGLTQAEAAEKAGISTAVQWSQIETGTRQNLYPQTLQRIALALECTVDELLQPIEPIAQNH